MTFDIIIYYPWMGMDVHYFLSKAARKVSPTLLRLIMVWNSTKTLHTGEEKERESWEAPYYGGSLSSGKALRIVRALHWDKTVT